MGRSEANMKAQRVSAGRKIRELRKALIKPEHCCHLAPVSKNLRRLLKKRIFEALKQP